MEKAQAKLESIKMVREWSTWLIAIQTTVCAFLWNILKERGLKDLSGITLHCGWLAFSFSIIIATVLISRLPTLIENLADESSSDKSIFTYPLRILGINLNLKILLIAEHVCFLLGVLLIIIFVIMRMRT
jgi:hypothetical protein